MLLANSSPTHRLTTVILAGGASERMGTDKAQMLVAGERLVQRVAAALAATSGVDSILIVGGDPGLHELARRSVGDTPVIPVPDVHPGEGPLGGTITGLQASDTAEVLIVACDLPNLDPEPLDILIAARRSTNADRAVPMVAGQRQWHCVVWHRRALGHLETSFEAGERSLRSAGANASESVLVLDETGWLTDLDTPADYQNFDAGR